MSEPVVLPSIDGEPACHCGRMAEDGDTICGHRRYPAVDEVVSEVRAATTGPAPDQGDDRGAR